MEKTTINIILAGVGGQGILSIATVIAEAATEAGLLLKQAEVHGMSQRGGDVQSHLRLSKERIHSDLIPKGEADLIISMEPMEALRYVHYLAADAWVICSSESFKNIPDYPSEPMLSAEIQKLPNVVSRPIETMAREQGVPKCANMILLGMASKAIGILSAEQLRSAIGRIFGPKGESVVAACRAAFDLGLNAE